MEGGGSVAEGFVGQAAGDGVSGRAVAAAFSAPIVGVRRCAQEERFVFGELLADAGEVQCVEVAEGGEVRGGESRLIQVEVFRLESVGTSIFGRPRPVSG